VLETRRREPRVGIGLPVYQGERFLDAALRSIAEQTFEDFELLVLDNASTDRTEEIARGWADRDPRVRYERQPENVGAGPNFNDAFHRTRGELFKWAAHDDLLHPDFLAACVRGLDEDPRAILAYPRAEIVDEQGRLVESYDARLRTDAWHPPHLRFKDLLLSWHRCFEVFGVIRRSALERTALIRPYGGSDRTLLQELALLGPFHEIRHPLFRSRRHDLQSTTATRARVVERVHWFDTGTRGRIVLPTWDLVRDNLRVLRRSDAAAIDKARMALYVVEWSRRHSKELARDLTRATRLAIGRLASR
jgi:glycosyltransferase involved in cell wall biosynthesis